ncbi:MAG: ribosome biogenesis GTP-binding protein YsxC, partial [Acidobacteriaceae bacterium]
RETLAACVCLVDMNVPPQPGDVMLAEYLDSIHRSRIIVGTKADKLSGNERVVATRRLREALETDDILVCSAKDGRGISALWKAIHGIAEEAKRANAESI